MLKKQECVLIESDPGAMKKKELAVRKKNIQQKKPRLMPRLLYIL